LSDIGGVAQSIISIAIFLNNFINKYIILLDIETLLNNSNISIKDLTNHKDLKLKKLKTKINKENMDVSSIKEKVEENNNIPPETKDSTIDKNNILFQKPNKENAMYNDEKNYKFEDTNIVDNTGKDSETYNNIIDNKNKKLKFVDYIFYKLKLKKRDNYIELYEAFREKMISVEKMIDDHLILNNLLKANNIDKNC
jgi:hypothetical protein